MYSTHGDMVVLRSEDMRHQRPISGRVERPPLPERQASLTVSVESPPGLVQALIDRVVQLEARLERLEAELAEVRGRTSQPNKSKTPSRKKGEAP